MRQTPCRPRESVVYPTEASRRRRLMSGLGEGRRMGWGEKHGIGRAGKALCLVVCVCALVLAAGGASTRAAGNPIASENTLSGTTAWQPREQGLSAADQHALEGY